MYHVTCHNILVKIMIETVAIFVFVFVGSLFGTFLLIQYFFKSDKTLPGPAIEITKSFSINKSPTTQLSTVSAQLHPLTSLDQVDLQQKIEGDFTSVLVTGDVLLARSVNAKMTQMNDFRWPFLLTNEKLQEADITFVNLETPLVTNCPVKSDGMIFCGDPRSVDGLLYAGVDVVNFANNHAGNWEKEGIAETVQLLQDSNIEVTGINQFAVKSVNGIKFAFLGFNEVNSQSGVPDLSEDLVSAKVREARSVADVVIVQFHWGAEYTYSPTANQVRWAHYAVNAGADVVVGNHPHWWQPLEFYKDKLIVYSHGNFVFDQMWSMETRIGIVGEYFFQEKKLVDFKIHPIRIDNYGQPVWLDGKEKLDVLNSFINKSVELENTNSY